MALGKLFANLGPVAFSAQPVRVDLNPGVNIHAIILRLTAAVTVTGGTTSGTLLTEGVQRIIKSIRIRHDGDDRVSRITGRALYRLTRRTRLSVRATTQLANANAQTATPINVDLVIPIEQPWLAQPALTVWPGSMRVAQELAIYIEFEQTANAGAGSGAGTGALISGGDRAVTFATAPSVQVIQQYSTGALVPWYMTRINAGNNTDQFSAANANLPYRLQGQRRISAMLLRALEGANTVPADLINNVAIQAGGGALQLWDRLDFTLLEGIDQGAFPAVATDDVSGELFMVFTDNGLLTTNLDPRIYNQPRILLDVDAPGSAPGVVDVTTIELDSTPWTSQPD